MKTQILQLEPHDDAISVRDKMSWGKAARIVLVWPAGTRILNRRLDLVLLQRCSNSLGAQLGLVCTDPEVHFYAKELRIPVFNTLRQAQSDKWRVGRRLARRPARRTQRRAPRPDLEAMHAQAHPTLPAWVQQPLTRHAVYTLTLLAFLLIAAVTLPGARLTLVPETRTQDIFLTVTASTAFRSPNLSGELPAHPISIVVEGRDTITATKTIPVPELSATGTVKFTNLTTGSVSIPEGSIVSALDPDGGPSIRFATTRAARMPAGVGTTLNLPVRALAPGKSSNLPVGRIQAIEGPLGLSLMVTNSQATRGGTDRLAASPGPEDYKQLYEKLEQALRQTALLELEDTLSQGSFPLTTTLVLSSTVEQVYNPPLTNPNDTPLPAERLHLTLRLEYQAMVVKTLDLESTAAGILGANLTQGFIPKAGTLALEHLSLPKEDPPGMYRWRLRASQDLRAELSSPLVLSLVRGRSPQTAAGVLYQALQVEQAPRIEMSPSWWPWMPLWPARISLLEELP